MRCFALLTLIALVAAGCGGSEAEEVEVTGSIAFIRDRQLWVMNADGSGQRALTRDSAEKWSPAWSPDGRRIAYASSGTNYSSRISVNNADGSGRLRLSRGYKYDQQSAPAWSPDGRTIAFHGYDDGSYWISSVGADGIGQRTLTPGGLGIAEDGGFAWSPDGRKIAFTNVHDVGVYVMNRDGSGRHLLARTEATDRTQDGAFRTGDPAWSPDGRRIACISDGVLWVMNADGTRPRRLVDSHADKPNGSPGDLAWSPGGRKIAFTQEGQIFVVNGDGSELRKLTDNGSASDVAPVWSPDGRAITFTSDRDGNSDIYVMNAGGSRQRNVSQNPLEDFSPAWSPKD